jgi:hypothetical protein
MDSREAERAEVSANYQAFLADLPMLIASNSGRYAVYHHQRLIDIYDTYSAAIAFGVRTFDDRLFSVQEITGEPLTLGCPSDASDDVEIRSHERADN